jgi:hypothetical protein
MNSGQKNTIPILSTPAMIIAIVLTAMGFVPICPAEPINSPQISTVTVEGTATMYGDWSCTGQASVRAIPGRALESVPGFPGGISKAVIEVSVKGIECGDGTMNEHLRKALKEKEHPTILFQMDKYKLEAGGKEATAFGELTIAGVAKPIEMNVDLEDIRGKGVRARGKVAIKMKEYGVKPPSLLFGALKVANDVTVKFDSLVQPPSETE